MAPIMGLLVTPVFPEYHWKVAALPDVATVNVAVLPLLMVTATGWDVIAGAVMTVAVALPESAVPASLVTRSQKLLLVVSGPVVSEVPVAPATGLIVDGAVPRYH